MTAEGTARKDFFVVYNRADRAWAEWIAWQLEIAELSTVVQAWDFTPGANWVLEMQQAASTCDRTLAVLSPDFLGAPYPQPEWAAAFALDPMGAKRKLVPVMVRDCEPTGLLSTLVPIRLFGLSEAEAAEALIQGVQPGRHKPTMAPTFPGRGAAAKAPPPFPRISRLLLARNQNFVGRADELDRIAELFSAPEAGKPVVVALTGLGGVGKTLLAMEYAYRHLSDYDLVWSLRGANRQSIETDLAALAEALRLAKAPGSLADAAVDYLSRNGGWLLVFDNVKEPKEIARMIPRGFAGHVLVTSQSSPWRELGTEIVVDVLRHDDSVLLINKLSGDADASAVAVLSEKLGRLPLALVEAASFVAASGSSVSAYVTLLNDGKVLSVGRAPADYGKTVASVWTHAFREVARSSSSASNLMAMICFLAPDDIPMSLLMAPPPNKVPPFGDAAAIRIAVAELRRFSFVQTAGSSDAIAVHRMVQAVGRQTLPRVAFGYWSDIAVVLITGRLLGIDHSDRSTWGNVDRLIPHLLHALSLADLRANNNNLAEPAYLGLFNVSESLRARGRAAEARKHLEEAVRIAERARAPDAALLMLVGGRGHLELEDKNFNGALGHLQRALVIATAIGESVGIAVIENALGLAYRGLSKFSESLEHYGKAFEATKAAGMENSPVAAGLLDNMAHVFRAVGARGEARAAAEGALKMFEAAPSDTRIDRAIVHDLLATLAKERREFNVALKHADQALSFGAEALGDSHPTVLAFRHNRASLLASSGQLGEAAKVSREVVTSFERLLGVDHPETATARSILGGILADLGGSDDEALDLFRAAKVVLVRTKGIDSPDVVWIQLDEAELLAKQKRFDAAIELGEDAVAKIVSMFGFVSEKARAALRRVHAMYVAAGYDDRKIAVTVPDDEVLRSRDLEKGVGTSQLRKGQVIEVGAQREESGLTLVFQLEKDQVPTFSEEMPRPVARASSEKTEPVTLNDSEARLVESPGSQGDPSTVHDVSSGGAPPS